MTVYSSTYLYIYLSNRSRGYCYFSDAMSKNPYTLHVAHVNRNQINEDDEILHRYYYICAQKRILGRFK